MEDILVKELPKNDFCLVCGKMKKKLVRLSGQRTLTRNFTKICSNEKCSMFLDPEKIKNWVGVEGGHYQRDFRRQNRPEYNPKRNPKRYTWFRSENSQTLVSERTDCL